MDTKKKLSPLTIGLHWLVAISILGLIGLGLYMVENEAWHLFDLHKSIGLLVFMGIVVRVSWRLKNGLPQPVPGVSRFEHKAAVITHWLLLVCTIVMPIFGLVFSAASGHGFGLFSVGIFPENPNLAKPGEVIPFNADLADLGQRMHDTMGYVLLCLIVLHALAALKHHFFDKDETLTRMLGRGLRD